MAFRYRQRHIETGDILDPRDWNENMSELTGEFNGYLDRDNLPASCITAPMIEANTFNDIQSFSDQTNTVELLGDNIKWQSLDSVGGSTLLGQLTVTADVDCLLIVEFSGWWLWKNNGTALGTTTLETTDPIVIRLRVTVDGFAIHTTGWFSASKTSNATHLFGATPVSPGKHTVDVEAQIGKLVWDSGAEVELLREAKSAGSGVGYAVVFNDRELIVHMRKR